VYLRLESLNHKDFSWLTGLSFPNLQSLSVTDGYLFPQSFRFIHRHPSIKTLECKLFNLPRELEPASPQLTYLIIHHTRAFGSDLYLFHKFQHLRSLKILDNEGYFSRDEFESLVKKRCLPSSHNQSQLAAPLKFPLEVLKIVSRQPPRHSPSSPSFNITPWSTSILINDATRDETEGSKRILSWL
jgi:hypothetical protein